MELTKEKLLDTTPPYPPSSSFTFFLLLQFQFGILEIPESSSFL